jgi:hypothetical protein
VRGAGGAEQAGQLIEIGRAEVAELPGVAGAQRAGHFRQQRLSAGRSRRTRPRSSRRSSMRVMSGAFDTSRPASRRVVTGSGAAARNSRNTLYCCGVSPKPAKYSSSNARSLSYVRQRLRKTSCSGESKRGAAVILEL